MLGEFFENVRMLFTDFWTELLLLITMLIQRLGL